MLGAVASLRLRRWEAGDALICACGGLLGGERRQHRSGERFALRVMGALDGVLPRRYRIVPAERVADALLQAALDAPPGRHVIASERLLA